MPSAAAQVPRASHGNRASQSSRRRAKQPQDMPRNAAIRTTLVGDPRKMQCAASQRMVASSQNRTRKPTRKRLAPWSRAPSGPGGGRARVVGRGDLLDGHAVVGLPFGRLRRTDLPSGRPPARLGRTAAGYPFANPPQALSDPLAFRNLRQPRAAWPARSRAAGARARAPVRLETMRSSTSVSHACGSTSAELLPPSSPRSPARPPRRPGPRTGWWHDRPRRTAGPPHRAVTGGGGADSALAPSPGGRIEVGVQHLRWPGRPQGQHLGGDRRGGARRRGPPVGRGPQHAGSRDEARAQVGGAARLGRVRLRGRSVVHTRSIAISPPRPRLPGGRAFSHAAQAGRSDQERHPGCGHPGAAPACRRASPTSSGSRTRSTRRCGPRPRPADGGQRRPPSPGLHLDVPAHTWPPPPGKALGHPASRLAGRPAVPHAAQLRLAELRQSPRPGGEPEAAAREQLRRIGPGLVLAPVVAALQALKGIQLVIAATLVAEVGDFSRFASPRQLMAFLGLVLRVLQRPADPPGRHHEGRAAARSLLFEAAWSYRPPAKVGQAMWLKQRGVAQAWRDIS